MLAICCFIVVLVLCWIWKGLKNYVCIYWYKNRQWMFCNFFLRRIWQHCWAEEIKQKKQWMHKNHIEWPNINIEQLVGVTNKHRINDLINRVILQTQTILQYFYKILMWLTFYWFSFRSTINITFSFINNHSLYLQFVKIFVKYFISLTLF